MPDKLCGETIQFIVYLIDTRINQCNKISIGAGYMDDRTLQWICGIRKNELIELRNQIFSEQGKNTQ